MYFKLKDQKNIINMAIKKAGSERKLAKTLNVVKSAIYYYKHKGRPISRYVLNKLMKFLGLEEVDIEQIIQKRLDKNWKQRIGGKASYLKKVRSKTFRKNLIKMKKASSRLHKKLRKELGEKYFLEQYERFKKIGSYKFKTKRGELVRNTLEKKIADTLFQFGINYQYEPCINVNKKYYFPDFKVGNLIVECSMWKGFDKAMKLKKKIKDLQQRGYKVFVITPNNLRKFYKSIEEYLIDENKLLKNILSPRSPRSNYEESSVVEHPAVNR